MSVADIICISLLAVLILLVVLFLYELRVCIRDQIEQDKKVDRILSALEKRIDNEVFFEFEERGNDSK